MRVLVVLVGKDKNDPLKGLAESYLLRTNKILKPSFLYVKEGKRKDNSSAASIEEGKEILRVTQGYFRIALDLSGKHLNSIEFARNLEKLLMVNQRPVAFIVGGATGLSPQVLDSADQKWSLSKLTFPHRLAYLILSEQIYRAGEILRRSPYHK